jgi:rRNA maturation endonuclease Nob1
VPAPAATVCSRCNTRLERPSKFCPECGNSLA